ncbi:hypothetical protein [Micromonospora sp. WMMA1947]|uniref:hypothetical protein n=1 Tax=Micromonospora sp. WMMA1947 TaxID=3015163 RepID=UPI00248B5B25|nr:hypothetical protein [Micromonospora sp. WMMA1947]WBC10846.1 hypothetical protein O7604_08210 [Micromonospora sp. WMMA1947]
MPDRHSASLDRLLDYPNPDDRVRVIKTMVGDRLTEADPASEVRFTEYFNHTFAPDMVLSWPKENRERLVFVRPSSNPQWISDELRWISANKPIVMSLRSAFGRDADAEQGLAREAQRSDVLVTDPDAVQEISQSDQPMVDLLGHAILRGGRGLLDEDGSRSVIRRTAAGFVGAGQLHADQTGAAVELFAQILDPEQAGRMTRVVQAVWEGHGGTASSFPRSSLGITGPLTGEDVSLLLEVVETQAIDFWHRVGRNISLEQLGEMNVADFSPGLQSIVAANAERLMARGLRVIERPKYLGEPEVVPRWLVEGNCLVLRGWGWSVYFAASKNQLPPDQDLRPPTVREVRRRARDAGLVIKNVRVGTPDLTITFESTVEKNVMERREVAQHANSSDAVVTTATVSARAARGLICDLRTGSASGHTNASFELRDFIRYALPILLSLTKEERQSIMALLPPEAGAGGYVQGQLPI